MQEASLYASVVSCAVAKVGEQLYQDLCLGTGYSSLNDGIGAAVQAQGHTLESVAIEQVLFVSIVSRWPCMQNEYRLMCLVGTAWAKGYHRAG